MLKDIDYYYLAGEVYKTGRKKYDIIIKNRSREMKEEKRERESKVKKKLTKIIGTVIVGALLMMIAGCSTTGKGSRAWIEDKVANIEKVYPTENLDDLFEKFPNGFIIRQTRLFKEEDKSYSVDLELIGNKDTKKIEGKVRKVLLESKPYYKETIEEESKLEYIFKIELQDKQVIDEFVIYTLSKFSLKDRLNFNESNLEDFYHIDTIFKHYHSHFK